MRTVTERTLESERRADVVIDYERPDAIRIWTPPQSTCVNAADETLTMVMSNVTTKRELAVVIFATSRLCVRF